MRKITRSDVGARLASHLQPPDENGCILWFGKLDRGGYGRLAAGTFYPETAHRLAWWLAHGPIHDGLWVLHKCDVRACVSLDHLYLGTAKQNAADCHERGRWAWGERCGAGKLSALDVAWIRAYLATGYQARPTARSFGVHFQGIYDIKYGRTWTRVPGQARWARPPGGWKVA